MNLKEKFNISQKKVNKLVEKIRELKINLNDIQENITKGGGRGGQKVNKTSNKIHLLHIPTGLEVSCQRERQRNKNRFIALRELVDKIEMKKNPSKSTKLKSMDKKRKQKDRRKRRSKKKNVKIGERNV